jgi:hypothetical protein
MRMIALALALGLLVVALMGVRRLWRRRGEKRGALFAALAPVGRDVRGWINDHRPPITLEQVQYRAVDETLRAGERTVGGTILPDTVTLKVSVETERRLLPHWPRARRELADTLKEHATAEGYDWPDTRFELVGDPLLGHRAVRVSLLYGDRTVKGPGPGSPRIPMRHDRSAGRQSRRNHAGQPRRVEDAPREEDSPTWKPAANQAQPAWFLRRADGLSYRLPFGKPVTLGATRENDIIIGSAAVSRKHARLTAEPSGVLVEDLASTNGTFVNDVQLRGQQRLVRDGALRLGPDECLTLVYRVEAGVTP